MHTVKVCGLIEGVSSLRNDSENELVWKDGKFVHNTFLKTLPYPEIIAPNESEEDSLRCAFFVPMNAETKARRIG